MPEHLPIPARASPITSSAALFDMNVTTNIWPLAHFGPSPKGILITTKESSTGSEDSFEILEVDPEDLIWED
jgi:hypothetical protein